MKKQIRIGMFESNSSSCHTLCICSQDEFDQWVSGDLIFDKYEERLVKNEALTDDEKMKIIEQRYNRLKKEYWKDFKDLTKEELKKLQTETERDGWFNRELESYDDWKHDDYLETFVDTYTTKSGDKIVAFGKYGYDG